MGGHRATPVSVLRDLKMFDEGLDFRAPQHPLYLPKGAPALGWPTGEPTEFPQGKHHWQVGCSIPNRNVDLDAA